MFNPMNYSKSTKIELIEMTRECSSRRSSLLPNREKLKTVIRAYTIRLGNRADSPWVFYDDSNKDKYQIKDRLSAEIIASFRKSTIITLDVSARRFSAH